MEITKIKNVKDFPIVEQSEISEVLAYDAEGNLIRAKYDESEIDIDLSDYATKEELAKVQKDATKALDWAAVAQGTADDALARAKENAETLNGIEDSLNQWKDNVISGFDGWKTEVETSVNKAKEDAAQALDWYMIAQGTADAAWADAKAADSKAVSAQGTADSALATAQAADSKAVSAQGTADSALATAQAAQKNATTALNDAAVAQGTADDALNKAETNISEINSIKSTIGDINNILSSL